MPISELILQGVELMILGMGIVFFFLALLVVGLKGMARLAVWVEPPSPVAVSEPQDLQPELVAVISAAISRFRSDNR
jgi:oxaloacetate decarboxylase gamma subunit